MNSATVQNYLFKQIYFYLISFLTVNEKDQLLTLQ